MDGAAALADTVAEVPDVAGVCGGVADAAALPPGLAVPAFRSRAAAAPGPQPVSTAPASMRHGFIVMVIAGGPGTPGMTTALGRKSPGRELT